MRMCLVILCKYSTDQMQRTYVYVHVYTYMYKALVNYTCLHAEANIHTCTLRQIHLYTQLNEFIQGGKCDMGTRVCLILYLASNLYMYVHTQYMYCIW